MIANYHTHTWRCQHAVGTEREYVENAIAGGLKILGFSDHAPMPFTEDYISRVRMSMGQLDDYVGTILDLKKEYSHDIEIHIGLEAEYYPALFEQFIRFACDHSIEYLILGQHFLGNEIGDAYNGRPTDHPENLIRYCEQTIEALETGRFSYFAHPDLINFTGDDTLYQTWMEKLCRKALELDIPLEINFLGLSDRRHYPNPRFWEIAGRVGNKVIFGSDAHRPDMVWNPGALALAQEMGSRYRLDVLETLEMKRL